MRPGLGLGSKHWLQSLRQEKQKDSRKQVSSHPFTHTEEVWGFYESVIVCKRVILSKHQHSTLGGHAPPVASAEVTGDCG